MIAAVHLILFGTSVFVKSSHLYTFTSVVCAHMYVSECDLWYLGGTCPETNSECV